MTKTNMDKHDQGDVLLGIAETVLPPILEADIEGLIGAGRHEGSAERTTSANERPSEASRPTGRFRVGAMGVQAPAVRHPVRSPA